VPFISGNVSLFFLHVGVIRFDDAVSGFILYAWTKNSKELNFRAMSRNEIQVPLVHSILIDDQTP
jgi:hypothetical protein